MLMSLTVRRAAAIIILFNVLLAALAWPLFSDRISRWADTGRLLGMQEARLVILEANFAAQNENAGQAADIKRSMERAYSHPMDSFAELLEMVYDMGVEITGLHTVDMVRQPDMVQARVSVSAAGPYMAAVGFVRQMAESERYIQIERFEINAVSNGDSALTLDFSVFLQPAGVNP